MVRILTYQLPGTHFHAVLRYAEASRLEPANSRAKRGYPALSASHPGLDLSSMNIIVIAQFTLTGYDLGGGDLK